MAETAYHDHHEEAEIGIALVSAKGVDLEQKANYIRNILITMSGDRMTDFDYNLENR